MNKTFAWLILGCGLAGCAKDDPGERPNDAGEDVVTDLGVETGTDSALPDSKSEDGTDAVDATDAAEASDTAVTDTSDGGAPYLGEVWVVRVGDGSAALGTTAAPVFIDRFSRTGTLLGSMPLPTAASGANQALTLTGSSWYEGTLTRSTNEHFVTLVGYAAAVGLDYPSTTTTSGALRVVARIDAARTISTATTTTSYSEATINAAVTDDGTRFWLAGTPPGGISFLFGYDAAVSAVMVSSDVTNVRSLTLAGGALFGVKATDPKIFDFAGSLPTTSTTTTAVPGMTTSFPQQMIGFTTGSSGVDLIYLCDEKGAAAGGGLQRWTKTSGTWSVATRVAPTATKGCTKVAGSHAAGKTMLFAVTAENPSRLVAFEDDLASTATVTGTVIATPGINQAFRGVALEPR